MITRRVFVLGWLLVILVSVVPTSAQSEPPIDRLGIAIQDNEITLHRVDATGQFTPLEVLSAFSIYNITRQTRVEVMWEIAHAQDIVLSPDGQKIAFTAISDDYETALFVYTLGYGFHRTDVPGLASVKWSPYNDALLLVPVEMHAYLSVSDIYLYQNAP